MKYIKTLFVILLFLSSINTSWAQEDKMSSMTPTFNTDYMKEINAAKEKLLALADAFPQDKYGWRPSEGVRSTSEVFMHVVGANYFLLTFIGGKLPAGITRDMEKTVTKKEDVKKWLSDSYDNLEKFMAGLDPKTLNDPAEYFGIKGDKRHLLLILLDHNHEHLGQSIAYARMNKIVPPWSK